MASDRTTALHVPILAEARQHPLRAALASGPVTWTYRQLGAGASHLAAQLNACGLGEGDVVAVAGHRRPELAAAVLGILASGAAFAVLDDSYPHSRRDQMLEGSGAVALVMAGEPSESDLRLSAYVANVFTADLSVDSQLATGVGSNVRSDAIAYIGFTSGTSGRPNCVVGTHSPVSHYLRWSIKEFAFDSNDRFVLLSGLSHDPLMRDMLLPLAIGAVLVVPPETEWRDPKRLIDLIADNEVTVVHSTPTMARRLLRARDEQELPSVRCFFLGGEPLTWPDVDNLKSLTPNSKIINLYGATETPQAAMFYEIQEAFDEHRDLSPVVPLGKPIEGFDSVILNKAGKRVAPGETGEIAVVSEYLSQGYKDNEALTRERFLRPPSPASGTTPAYLTGDIGLFLPDGSISFAGRADRQVTIGGTRIELPEIEHFMRAIPGVAEAIAAVAMRSGSDLVPVNPSERAPSKSAPEQEKTIIAYALADPDSPLTSSLSSHYVRSYLADYLPAAAVPERVGILQALPLNANGKIDYAALPSLQPEIRVHTADGVQLIESTLIPLWQRVLGESEVDIVDNFFDLGGDSLSALELAVAIEEELGMEIEMDALFVYPTVRDLAGYLSAKYGGEDIQGRQKATE